MKKLRSIKGPTLRDRETIAGNLHGDELEVDYPRPWHKDSR